MFLHKRSIEKVMMYKQKNVCWFFSEIWLMRYTVQNKNRSSIRSCCLSLCCLCCVLQDKPVNLCRWNFCSLCEHSLAISQGFSFSNNSKFLDNRHKNKPQRVVSLNVVSNEFVKILLNVKLLTYCYQSPQEHTCLCCSSLNIWRMIDSYTKIVFGL